MANLWGWVPPKCVRQYSGDSDSCFLMFIAGKVLARHHVLRFQTLLSREIGVTVAEFQSYLNPDISGPELTKSPTNPYYDSELKRIYQDKFRSRCLKYDRCMNPSHFILFRDGHPYIASEDFLPLPAPVVEHILSRSHLTILQDAVTRTQGSLKRSPDRIRRLNDKIDFLLQTPINTTLRLSLEKKVHQIIEQENINKEWIYYYEQYKLNHNDDDLDWLLSNLPHLKGFLPRYP